MSKHEEVHVDLDQPYEQNVIGVKGIIYFVIGLFLLIVITFGLMWIFQYQVLQSQWDQRDEENKNPLALTKDERLPPEPRLQAAPGFKVKNPNGNVINLELKAPQAEYWELEKIWDKELKEGTKDAVTGTVISLPIEEAKKKLLADGNLKAKSGEDAKKAKEEAGLKVSSASSGRVASNKLR